MDMPASEGSGLIFEAMIQRDRERSYELYLVMVPGMTQDTFISFEEFLNKSGTPRSARANTAPKKKKTKQDIMNEVEDIMKNYEV